MLNQTHLKVVSRGTKAIESWHRMNPSGRLLLRGAQLQEADLDGADLRGANLREADLTFAHLRRANLAGATLARADMDQSDLTGADLTRADLSEVDLSWAEARNAQFRQADITWVRLWETSLDGANFAGARAFVTIFGDTDLSKVKGLDKLVHVGPSIVDDRTLRKSSALPLSFLRGCGLPEALIDYLPKLRGKEPIRFPSCFISYSSKDEAFAKRLHTDLQNKGVRCWFAPEHIRIGEKIRKSIDQAIREYDKLLLVLSKASMKSDWVESEVERALEKERRAHRPVLVPIRVDDSVMQSRVAWASEVRQRHVGDFRKWTTSSFYTKALSRLLHDLRKSD
ncbi:MAG TPA: toll/interleukin-1 receptor domain-containing protein [Thermoplasmata archaeon]|nr:toll/interleukin-1 receptor domain-containing protein [Thermoplasmata archaeon]